MRAPAYAKALMARRRRGERIGLLVVAVHDWHAGEEFTAHAEVARVVLPPDSCRMNWIGRAPWRWIAWSHAQRE
ncbi:MAG: hypothetical protein IPL29_02625 [Propionivibrio sp.]|nr:hypothetical protein [Propionivibrio sp.]